MLFTKFINVMIYLVVFLVKIYFFSIFYNKRGLIYGYKKTAIFYYKSHFENDASFHKFSSQFVRKNLIRWKFIKKNYYFPDNFLFFKIPHIFHVFFHKHLFCQISREIFGKIFSKSIDSFTIFFIPDLQFLSQLFNYKFSAHISSRKLFWIFL